jgi:uncharacterized protein
MANPYVYGVSHLLGEPGSTRRVGFEAPLEIAVMHATVVGPVVVDLDLESISGHISVAGSVEAPIEFTCNRCLTVWTETFAADIEALFGRGRLDDLYPLADGDLIDLEPVIRDELALALPLVPLCRPDCLGLCPTCGTDLNVSRCSGHEAEIASPFAGLRQLLDQD